MARSPRDRAPRRPGPELNRTDHEKILSNPKAKKAAATEAIVRAMAEDGLSRELAEELYGLGPGQEGDI